MRLFSKCWLLSSVSALVVLGALPAHAANDGGSAGGAPAAAATDQAASLGEIVVTARRREENLQRVPVAVSAYSAEELAAKRINTKEDLAANAASMVTISGGGPREDSKFALRGQGPSFGAIPGVITYFAEVPNAITIDGREGTYLDLANVQVLSGPQGTVFGKNATGGNVLFVPQMPIDKFEGYAQGELGNYSDRRFEGAINLPLHDKVGLRIAGAIARRDGYTKDVGPYFPGKDYDDLNYETVRAILSVEPVDWLKNTTIFRYYHSTSNGPGTVLTAFNPAANQGGVRVIDFYPDMLTEVAKQQALGIRQVAYDQDQYSKTTYWQGINTTTVNLSDTLQIKNIVSYSELRYSYGYDFDATINPIAGQGDRDRHESSPNQMTEELQLQGSALNKGLQFTLGAYSDNQTLSGHESSLFNYFPLSTFLGHPFVFFTDPKYRSHALFGQATLDVGRFVPSLEGLSLTAGYRYTWDHTSNNTQVMAPPSTFGEASFSYGSYALTANYQINPDVMIYATTRDAYKSGGVNGPVPEDSPLRTYPPEKLTDVEIGLKSQFDIAGIQGRANIAAYRGKYNNIQRTTTEVVDGALLNVVRSAAAGRIQGVEFDGTLIPVEHLTISGSLAYTDSKYTKVTDASAEAIIGGSAFPYTPKLKYTISARYDIPLPGDYGNAFVNAQYVRQGRFSTAQTNETVVNYLPAYGLLNLRAGVEHIAGRPVDVSVFATNVTNEKYSIGVFDTYNQSFGFVTQPYGEPRMYGAQVRYTF